MTYEPRLTRREQEVLARLRRRWTYAEIAADLHVSVRTVESHVAALLRKLGVPDRRSLGRPDGAPAPANPTSVAYRFVDVAGDRALAVAESGSGPALVKVATWMTQVDLDSVDSPIWGHWVRQLRNRHRYVRYDPRGCGLSDRDLGGVDLHDLGLWVDDLGRVLNSLGDRPVALLGISQGGPVAIGYAALHPERVSHLVLYGTYARGMRRRDDATQSAEATTMVDLASVAWASDNESFRGTFARQFVPEAGAVETDWFTEQLRATTTAQNAPLLEAAFHDLDVSELARQVRVPTLVMHALEDRAVPFEEGRRLAGLIPDARFVPITSRNHILMAQDIGLVRFVEELERFLAS